MSSIITISQPPVVPGDKIHPDVPTEMTFAPMDPDLDPEELDIEVSAESSESDIVVESSSSSSSTIVTVKPGEELDKDNKQTTHGSAVESGTCDDAEADKKAHETARMESLEKLQSRAGAGGNAGAGSVEMPRGPDKGKGKGIVKLSWKRGNAQVSARHPQTTSNNPDAVIVLKEEKVRKITIHHPLTPPLHLTSQLAILRRAPSMTFCDLSTPGVPPSLLPHKKNAQKGSAPYIDQ
jgi:hypothetical protein